MMRIAIERAVRTAVQPSARVMQTALMFGLGTDESRDFTIIPRTEIPIPVRADGGGIVFIAGPSGGGKTTVLRLISEVLQRQTDDARAFDRVISFDHLPALPGRPLVDALAQDSSLSCGEPAHEACSLERITAALSCAGLGDAFVMLRTPAELSDGQRYRLRLAQAMLLCAQDATRGSVILADEFAATLDRITAWTIARNIRRFITHTRHTLICATTHDDLLEALQPEVLIYKGLDAEIEICEQTVSPEISAQTVVDCASVTTIIDSQTASPATQKKKTRSSRSARKVAS